MRRADAAGTPFRVLLTTFALIVVTIAVTAVCIGVLRPFTGVICWAIALTVVSIPLYRRMLRKLKRPGMCAGIIVLLLGAALLIPTAILVQQTVSEVNDGNVSIPTEVKTGRFHELVKSSPRLSETLKWMEVNFDLRRQSKELKETILQSGPVIFSGSIWSVAQFLLIMFSVFFLLRDHRDFVCYVRDLIPLPNDEVEKLFVRVSETIHATLFGSLTVAAIQGALGGIMFWWLGLPAPVLWTAVMTMLALIPYLGAFVVWFPASLYLAMQGEETKAMILFLWGLLPVSLIDNLLYPILVGKQLRFHTLPVFFFIIGGVMFFGVIGIVLGPVTLAIADGLFQIWKQRLAQPASPDLSVVSAARTE